MSRLTDLGAPVLPRGHSYKVDLRSGPIFSVRVSVIKHDAKRWYLRSGHRVIAFENVVYRDNLNENDVVEAARRVYNKVFPEVNTPIQSLLGIHE